MRSLRLLCDPPALGPWNMAVDDVLLETAATCGLATLRFYTWEVATLSLGYFQASADRRLHAASATCPLVRRASGGGAIVHDRELTYSLALPLSDFRHSQATELYDTCHQSLIQTLLEFGAAASLYRASAGQCQSAADSGAKPKPFLCFQRRTCTDVVCGDAKIAGSAQRRRRGAVLQHGSILLATSPFAPELPGLCEVASLSLSSADLASRWMQRLADRLGKTIGQSSELTDHERQSAERIVASRFAADEFTLRR